MTRSRLVLLALIAGVVLWVAVPLGYSVHGLWRAAEAKIGTLGLYHARLIKFRLPCSGALSVGFIVVYRKKREDFEEQGRLCYEDGGWVWFPYTDNLAGKPGA